MSLVTGEVRDQMLESQLARKARLDRHRSDVQFKPGDEVLLDTTHTLFPSRDKLLPHWMGPFRVLAKTAPNTYCLDFPRAGAPSRSVTWDACVATSTARLRWSAMIRSQLPSSASTVNWSMRCRQFSSSPSAPVVHTFLYVGPVSVLPLIPGSLWRI